MPLFYNDRVIGALEFLDRQGAPAFSTRDMELLGQFAKQAAVAIAQSRTHQNLVARLAEVLASLRGISDAQKARLAAGAPLFARRVQADPAYVAALELARLVQTLT